MFENLSIHTVVHIVVALVFPPLLLGVINRVKAIFGGRRGQPLLQAYLDLRKLFSKECVISETTTWVFRFGPVVGLSTALVAAMIVPLGHASAPLSFAGDLILLAYVLGLGRFFTMAAALDTGSAFEGMGSAREATYACLAEPVLFLGLLVLARVTGTLSMSGLLGTELLVGWGGAAAALLLILVSWFVVMLVENCRIPFDDPNTHLELTMIHEVMVLDHSGPAFGLILYGASIKLFVFASLIVRLALPLQSGYPAADWIVFMIATVGCSLAMLHADVDRGWTGRGFVVQLDSGTGIILLIVSRLVCGYWLAGRATRPLNQMIVTMSKLRPSKLDERLDIRGTDDELDRLSLTFNRLLDRIGSYLKERRDSLANAAHELRTPLAAIRSSIEVALASGRTVEEYEELLGEVIEEASSLELLVNQLLLLSETEAERLRVHKEYVRLDELIDRAIDMFGGVAEYREIQLVCPALPRVAVNGNCQHLRQVVYNLIDNSPLQVHDELRHVQTTCVCIWVSSKPRACHRRCVYFDDRGHRIGECSSADEPPSHCLVRSLIDSMIVGGTKTRLGCSTSWSSIPQTVIALAAASFVLLIVRLWNGAGSGAEHT